MLKKIGVGQLRSGMYIQELCGSWLDTPFWKKSFMLDDQPTLDKILKSNIEEVVIDTNRGLDVEAAPVEDAPVEEEVATSSAAPLVAAPPQRKVRVVLSSIAPVSMEEEIGRAAKIVDRSREAVESMFHEARMGNAIDSEKVAALVDEIASSVMRNPGALIGLARLKTADDYTYMHSVAVCALMIALAGQLKLDEDATREAGLAGLLHDIGKMAVEPDILNKPGKLTDAEFIAVKEHPAAGHKILLATAGISEIALDVCLHHHEKMDGSGYPHQLAGEQISLHARMGAVCDVYDAITSNRPYKQGWCPAESLRRMAEWSNSHFDDVVFQAFVRSIGIFPVGTLVLLASGKLGVVVEQQIGKSLLSPKVRVFFSTKAATYIKPELIDLAGPGIRDKIISREDAAKWHLKDVDSYWIGDALTPG